VDAGDQTPDAASTEPVHLLDYAHSIAGLVQGYRQAGDLIFELPGSMLVRMVEYSPISKMETGYTIRTYADTPGTSGLSAGDLACTISGTLTIAPVDGFDPLDRIHVDRTITADDCFDNVGISDEQIYEVRERDADGIPTLYATWQLTGDGPGAPFPGWVWTDNGRATPHAPCTAESFSAGREYCTPDCDWDLIFDPTGDCPQ
jgi:hypothetical protein